MGTFILRRLLSLVTVMLGVSFLAFFFVHLIPGDPAMAMLGERATPEGVAQIREMYGLNDPLPVQYFRFAGRLMVGDLGRSIQTNNPVSSEFSVRFPATAELAVAAMLLAVLIGIPAGMIAATRRNSIFDLLSTAGALVGVSMPIYWLGLMLIWFLAIIFHWFPPGGRLGVDVQLQTVTNFYVLDSILTANTAALKDALWHLALPALALSTHPMAIITRMTRSCMLDVLGQDYVRTARSKGLREIVINTRHVLKNAALPVVTVVGLQTGLLLGGTVLTETIFSWPGIGRWIFDSIMWRDYPVIQSMILVIATIFVLINLAVDLLYAALDPRVRVW